MLRNKISKQLPFKLIDDENIKRNILSNFEVLNIEEWHEKYPEYPIEAI